MNNNEAAKKVFNHPVAWGPVLLGGILALFGPGTILDSEAIKLLAKFAAKYTGIYELANRSAYPREALAFYAIAFSAFPFQLVFLWMRWEKYMDFQIVVTNFRAFSPLKRIGLTILAPIATVVLYWGLFFLPEDPSFCKGCTTDSRFDLLPIFSTSLKLVKSAFEGRSGHEEAVHGRADHRVPQAGRGRGGGQGSV